MKKLDIYFKVNSKISQKINYNFSGCYISEVFFLILNLMSMYYSDKIIDIIDTNLYMVDSCVYTLKAVSITSAIIRELQNSSE